MRAGASEGRGRSRSAIFGPGRCVLGGTEGDRSPERIGRASAAPAAAGGAPSGGTLGRRRPCGNLGLAGTARPLAETRSSEEGSALGWECDFERCPEGGSRSSWESGETAGESAWMLSKIEICVGGPRKADPGALYEFHSYVARYKCPTNCPFPTGN